MLVAMLLLLSVLNFVLMLVITLNNADAVHSPVPVILAQFLFLGATIAVKRGHIDSAGTLTALIVTGLSVAAPIINAGSRAGLISLIVPLFMVSLAVKVRFIVAITVVQLSSLLCIGLFVPQHNPHSIVPGFFLPLLAMALFCLCVGAIVHRMIHDKFVHKIETAEQAERDLREQAEAASKAKSQFLAAMSHELRTPLNAIIGYSELFIEEMEQEQALDREFLPDVQRVQKAGKHLLDLVSGVLDLAKVEAGQMQVYPEAFDLSAMVYDVLGTLEPIAADRQNTTSCLSEVEPLQVVTDMKMTRQILLNLMSNALKFTKGGRVDVVLEQVGEDGVAMRVIDTGMGMTPEQLHRVFDEFVQADASTTREYGGTGLGLALVKHFCALLGGRVVVTSEPGRGTEFKVMLPRVWEAPHALTHEQEPARSAA